MSIRIPVIALAVITLVGSPAFAQTVGGGFKVGLNLANLDIEFDDENEVEPEFDTKPGLIIGGYVSVAFNDQVSFQPEVLFTQKGAKLEEGGEDAEVDLDFIQIPALMRFNFRPGHANRPYVIVGPGIGFRTKANATLNGVEEDISDDTESVEFSGIVGGGIQVGRGLLEARYDYGFVDLDKEEGSEARSRTFSVLFGVGF